MMFFTNNWITIFLEKTPIDKGGGLSEAKGGTVGTIANAPTYYML
jgi:hypothetical protein